MVNFTNRDVGWCVVMQQHNAPDYAAAGPFATREEAEALARVTEVADARQLAFVRFVAAHGRIARNSIAPFFTSISP